jgi:DNA-binding winged helix-turn-helix (wHTH) protein
MAGDLTCEFLTMSLRLRFGDDWELEEHSRRLTRAGVGVAIEPKPFDLIVYLVRQRDRVVSKQELHEHLWPQTFVGDSRWHSVSPGRGMPWVTISAAPA